MGIRMGIRMKERKTKEALGHPCLIAMVPCVIGQAVTC